MSSGIPLRVVKFCTVGAIGVAVQLGVLAALGASRLDYLLTTVIAVECAILHNFWWHWHFTFANQTRRKMRDCLGSLLRFHLSNGLISLAGNLLLMRVLVGSLRLPLLLANVGTIGTCFIANFLASDRWVFRSP